MNGQILTWPVSRPSHRRHGLETGRIGTSLPSGSALPLRATAHTPHTPHTPDYLPPHRRLQARLGNAEIELRHHQIGLGANQVGLGLEDVGERRHLALVAEGC